MAIAAPRYRFALACLLIGLAAVSCVTSPSATHAAEPLRIMQVGDSITVGYTDNPSWANHPFEHGYRSGLYTRLTDAGYNFQFVGGSTEPFTGISGDPTQGGTVSPTLDLRDFGQDGHRGYGGASIGAINSGVPGWITTDQPDAILLLIGINGINASSPGQLDTLANTIVTNAPDAHLIIAQITPLAAYNPNLFDYNTHIRDTLVPNLVAGGHSVSTVDLYTMFLTNPGDPTSIDASRLSNRINHPTNPLYDQMAQAWFDEIQSTPQLAAFAAPAPAALPAGLALLGVVALRRGLRKNGCHTSPSRRCVRM